MIPRNQQNRKAQVNTACPNEDTQDQTRRD